MCFFGSGFMAFRSPIFGFIMLISQARERDQMGASRGLRNKSWLMCEPSALRFCCVLLFRRSVINYFMSRLWVYIIEASVKNR